MSVCECTTFDRRFVGVNHSATLVPILLDTNPEIQNENGANL